MASRSEKVKEQKRRLGATPEGKEKSRASYRAYYESAEGREQIRRQHRAYGATPEGKAKIAARRDTPKYKEQRKAYMAAYRVSPEGKAKILAACARRRAIKAGAVVGDMKAIAEWEKTWRTANKVTCHWCGGKFAGKDCQADHVIPLGKDGPHSLDNLCIACEKCNLKKCNKHPAVFNAELEQPLLFW